MVLFLRVYWPVSHRLGPSFGLCSSDRIYLGKVEIWLAANSLYIAKLTWITYLPVRVCTSFFPSWNMSRSVLHQQWICAYALYESTTHNFVLTLQVSDDRFDIGKDHDDCWNVVEPDWDKDYPEEFVDAEHEKVRTAPVVPAYVYVLRLVVFAMLLMALAASD